ncbi:MAG: hypothetical protein OXU74_06700 [Gemmatimonadota bacterium]|nr:hypothetical protein [Gemmatimonadota bacterium]
MNERSSLNRAALGVFDTGGFGPLPDGQPSRIALFSLTRDLGFVPLGLRTSFRNWCAETGVRREVALASGAVGWERVGRSGITRKIVDNPDGVGLTRVSVTHRSDGPRLNLDQAPWDKEWSKPEWRP